MDQRRTSTPLRHDEAGHRRAANRAVGVSALGLGVTGAIELALAMGNRIGGAAG